MFQHVALLLDVAHNLSAIAASVLLSQVLEAQRLMGLQQNAAAAAGHKRGSKGRKAKVTGNGNDVEARADFQPVIPTGSRKTRAAANRSADAAAADGGVEKGDGVPKRRRT